MLDIDDNGDGSFTYTVYNLDIPNPTGFALVYFNGTYNAPIALSLVVDWAAAADGGYVGSECPAAQAQQPKQLPATAFITGQLTVCRCACFPCAALLLSAIRNNLKAAGVRAITQL